MKSAGRWVAAAAGVVFVLGVTCAGAQDWPQWRGPSRDGKAGEFNAPAQWPQELTKKWQVNVGLGDGTPALAGNRLYVFAREGGDEVTWCLDADTGKELWKDKVEAKGIGGPAARAHSGPRSSPAVADGKVVTLGIHGVLSCLDATSGKVLWRKDPFPGKTPRFYTASSPLIVDGVVVAELGGPGDGAVIAYNLADGAEKWRLDGEAPDYSSPVLMTVDGTKQIVALTDKSVVGVGLADGKLLWKVAFVPQRMAYNAATPIVDGQTVIVTGRDRGTKALKVEKQGAGFGATELWSNDLAVQFNTPVLKDGFLYGLTDRGSLFCINARTGQTAWTDETQHGRGGFGAVVDAGTCLVALPATGELIVFKPAGDAFAQLAKIKVSDSATYATPVLSGNRVFVKDEGSVTLYTVP